VEVAAGAPQAAEAQGAVVVLAAGAEVGAEAAAAEEAEAEEEAAEAEAAGR
jgi:hypothetical protein